MLSCACGEQPHLRVHEAGHAVAAVDFGVPFLHVSVFSRPVDYTEVAGLEKRGGLAVDLDRLRPLWPLEPDGYVTQSAMFAVALAGDSAERSVLGHVLSEHASIGDFWMYVGWLPRDGRRPESWTDAKRRDPATVEEVSAWSVTRRRAVERVAAALRISGCLVSAEVARLID